MVAVTFWGVSERGEEGRRRLYHWRLTKAGNLQPTIYGTDYDQVRKNLRQKEIIINHIAHYKLGKVSTTTKSIFFDFVINCMWVGVKNPKL